MSVCLQTERWWDKKEKINDIELFDLALISQSETTRNVLQIVLRINILGMEKYKIKVVCKPNKMLLFFILGGRAHCEFKVEVQENQHAIKKSESR